MMIYIILFLIFLIILYSKNNNDIKILNKFELLDIILDNNYYRTFNQLDLQVRNVNSIDEYKQKIKNSPITINNIEENIIIYNINKINEKLKNYNTIGFNGTKASKIQWIIGIVNGELYEGGFPHTRKNVIILPKRLIFSPNLMKILLHEKVHIYQKIYSDDINNYLNYYKFKKTNIKYNNSRANPDIDNIIYQDQNNNIMCCLYNNNPKNIMDVTYYPINNEKYEHPYEFMAYTIENEL